MPADPPLTDEGRRIARACLDRLVPLARAGDAEAARWAAALADRLAADVLARAAQPTPNPSRPDAGSPT